MPGQVFTAPFGNASRVGRPTFGGSATLFESEFFPYLPQMTTFTAASAEPLPTGNISRWILVHNLPGLRVNDMVQIPNASNVASSSYARVVRILNSTTVVVDRPVPTGALQNASW